MGLGSGRTAGRDSALRTERGSLPLPVPIARRRPAMLTPDLSEIGHPFDRFRPAIVLLSSRSGQEGRRGWIGSRVVPSGLTAMIPRGRTDSAEHEGRQGGSDPEENAAGGARRGGVTIEEGCLRFLGEVSMSNRCRQEVRRRHAAGAFPPGAGPPTRVCDDATLNSVFVSPGTTWFHFAGHPRGPVGRRLGCLPGFLEPGVSLGDGANAHCRERRRPEAESRKPEAGGSARRVSAEGGTANS